MSEIRVEKGQVKKLGVVDGNLRIGKEATLIAEDGTIVVNGSINSKGSFVCEGNLEARSLKVKSGSAEIYGNLTIEQIATVDKKLDVSGSFVCPEVSVGGTLIVESTTKIGSASVGGTAKFAGNTSIESLRVGGTLKISEESDIGSVTVGGTARFEANAKVDSIDVGGVLKTQAGVFGTVKVGGIFKAYDEVDIQIIDVGGTVKLSTRSKIQDIDVGGTFKANSDLEFGILDVGGSVKIEGNAEGEVVKVGGTILCNENLTCSGNITVGGTCSVDKVLTGHDIEIAHTAGFDSGFHRCEVKLVRYDRNDTGRFAVEYESRDKPSGISTSRADLFAFIYEREFDWQVWVVTTARLRWILLDDCQSANIWRKSGGDNNTSQLLIFPRAFYYDHFRVFSAAHDVIKLYGLDGKGNVCKESQDAE